MKLVMPFDFSKVSALFDDPSPIDDHDRKQRVIEEEGEREGFWCQKVKTTTRVVET